MLSTNVPHWLVYVSGHGFGHWAQVAPILNMARETCPALRLTICSKVPRTHLQSRLHGDFTLIEDAADFGMVMASALDVLPQQSMDAYRAFHADWDVRLARETARIRTVQPSLLLSNVAYLPLAAAHVAGVPAIALCSLNWADIFQHYCGHLPDAAAIHQQILRSYQQARLFLRLTPAMPMTMLANQRTVGPIAHTGQCRREEVARKLALASDEKLVLVSMGGIATRLPMENWPHMSRIRWLVEAAWGVSRPDVAVLESLEMDFTDALASSDALLCKPGYGSFVEAVCHGIPVLYVSRQDWPEQICLTAWLHQYGAGQLVRRQMLEGGAFEPALQTLLALPRPQPLVPSGIKEALGLLWGHCRSNSMASP